MHSPAWFFALKWLPAPWRLPIWIAGGVALGLGVTVAHVSRATSYLSDQPETCVNCHVMYPQYLTWQHSSHREVASCNDCHVPHENLVRTYAFKAQDGLKHASIFTARLEPQVIRLSSGAVPVVQENCVRCHIDVVHPTALAATEEQRLCWDCHRDVPHGRVRSLSATPRDMQPELPLIGSGGGVRIGGRAPQGSQVPIEMRRPAPESPETGKTTHE